jgi:hypothetical protein
VAFTHSFSQEFMDEIKVENRKHIRFGNSNRNIPTD